MLKAALLKEFKLVFRDLHSVLVLFAMPAVFIMIMSLAMQDQFADKSAYKFEIKLFNAGNDPASRKVSELLQQTEHFQFEQVNIENTPGVIKELLGDSNGAYIYIPENLSRHFEPNTGNLTPIEIWLTPNIDARTAILITSAVKAALAKTKLAFLLATPGANKAGAAIPNPENDSIKTEYLYQKAEGSKKPTSVQQSVPAWLIFSMFFVVIPISTTMVTERQQGTLTRLRSMNISMHAFLGAKIFPYLLINQVQLVIMLLLGIYCIPLLGGEKLIIGSSYGGLALISLATGFSAVGYALLIATIARTTEQATSIGGIGNILLAAIGGIMVPKFVMPEYLQKAADISPMSWGLDGFLDIFLYGGGIHSILTEVAMLFGFGVFMLIAAFIVFHKQH